MRLRNTLVLGGLLALAGTLVAASPAAAKAAAAPSHSAPAAPGHNKPTSGTPTGPTFVPKPHVNSDRLVQPAVAFTVSIKANFSSVWSTQTVTVSADTNMDVGPMPYYIRIYDLTAQTYVALCGSGTHCSAFPNFSTTADFIQRNYTAYVGDSSAAFPPGSPQAFSGTVPVQ
jgi:hypothetical protein